MVRIFEWLAIQFKNFNNWFVAKWNSIISKLLFK